VGCRARLSAAGAQVRLRLQWVTEERRGRALCAEIALAGGALSVVGALQDELFNATLDQARSLTLTLRYPRKLIPDTGICAPCGGGLRQAAAAVGCGLVEAHMWVQASHDRRACARRRLPLGQITCAGGIGI
jgi:hypothetical protein